MKKPATLTAVVPAVNIEEAWREVGGRFRALLPDRGAGDVIEHDGRRKCPALRSPIWAIRANIRLGLLDNIVFAGVRSGGA